jgi:hypothetical protein
MMGGAMAGVPSIQFKREGQPTERPQAIKEAEDELCYRWLKKCSKWTKLKRDVTEGDIVL